ncbi:MAG: hypothetical protein HC800_05590 [Phormidesmis sp. RL_2_1]|nr:hypothetical protein [Phormidesmis sp. RL_2_1]
MVFATEFDPLSQSPRRQAAPAQDTHIAVVKTTPADDKRFSLRSPLSDNTAASTLQLNHRPALRVTPSSALPLPKKPKLPLWLQLLNRVQQGSTVLTCLLVTGALAVYGSTVYVDKSTHRALNQLDALQGESQQLTAASAAIKQSLAEQAMQANSGLEPYQSGDVLFLAPAPRRSAAVAESPQTRRTRPMGY